MWVLHQITFYIYIYIQWIPSHLDAKTLNLSSALQWFVGAFLEFVQQFPGLKCLCPSSALWATVRFPWRAACSWRPMERNCCARICTATLSYTWSPFMTLASSELAWCTAVCCSCKECKSLLWCGLVWCDVEEVWCCWWNSVEQLCLWLG